MGQKPLTWQQTLIVLCVLGLIPAAVIAWGAKIDDADRPKGVAAFFLLIALIGLLTIGHRRKVNRSDLQPDLLAQLFPTGQTLQLGPVHFVVACHSLGRWLRLTVVAQNLKDGDGDFRLTFSPEIHRSLRLAQTQGIFAAPLADFQCALSPASLVAATIKVPFAPMPKPAAIQIFLGGSASATGSLIRFGIRRAVTQRTSGWLALILVFLGGHVHLSRGTFLRIKYIPPVHQDLNPGTGNSHESEWQAITVWTPEHRATIPEIVSHIRRATPEQALTNAS